MITETMVLVLKLLALTFSITGALFVLTDKNYMSDVYYRIKYAMAGVPGSKETGGYLAGIFSYISSVLSTIGDRIDQYALPSQPVSDIYHM